MKRDELEAAVTNEESSLSGPLAQPVEQRAFNPRLGRATSTVYDPIPANPGLSPDSTLAKRFWAKVDQLGPPHPYDPSLGRCHLWTGAKRRRGYGCIWRNGKAISAARVGWELLTGQPFPPKLEPLHSCDRPECVNGRHVRPGTRKENVAEMHARGRTNLPRGRDHWNWRGGQKRRAS